MSILERKKAIKLSADVAMASTRVGTTCWSRALMAKASKDATDNKILLEHINHLGSASADDNQGLLLEKKKKEKQACKRIFRSKKILRKCCTAAHRRLIIKKRETNNNAVETASSIAKNLVKKRTQLLKSLVPGGESMDEVSLIRETLDYIVSLRLQVEVMRHLANATVQLEHEHEQK